MEYYDHSGELETDNKEFCSVEFHYAQLKYFLGGGFFKEKYVHLFLKDTEVPMRLRIKHVWLL